MIFQCQVKRMSPQPPTQNPAPTPAPKGFHSNKINSFLKKSEKVGIPKNPEFDGNLDIKTHFFPKT